MVKIYILYDFYYNVPIEIFYVCVICLCITPFAFTQTYLYLYIESLCSYLWKNVRYSTLLYLTALAQQYINCVMTRLKMFINNPSCRCLMRKYWDFFFFFFLRRKAKTTNAKTDKTEKKTHPHQGEAKKCRELSWPIFCNYLIYTA